MNPSAHILVVDDDPGVCEVIQQLLEDAAFGVTVAEDATAMRRLIAEHRFDLVILDATLPGESGASVARVAHRIGVPVIMMTGDPGNQDNVVGSGLPYILKPFPLARLLDLVMETLRRVAT